jgi:hypothetical protein
MTNIRDPEFNPNVAQVYTEEPGYTGYKGLDFTKIDNIEDILKSGINVNITGASTNFTINSAEVSVSNEVEIKNQIGNPVPISNESIDNLKNNFNNLIFSDSSAPSGLVVYQTNLNKDLDSVTVVISGNLPEVSGTVTANAGNFASIPGDSLPSKLAVVGAYLEDDHEVHPIPLVVNGLESSRQGVGVHVGSLPSISGTVTAKLSQNIAETDQRFIAANGDSIGDAGVHIAFENENNDVVLVGNGSNSTPLPISGAVTANVFGKSSYADNVHPIPVNEAGNSDNLLRHIPIGFVDGNSESAIVSNTTPLPVTAIQEKSSNISNFNSSETNGTVLSANSNRKELYIQNLATGNLYVKYGESASASSFNFILASNTSENAGDGGSLSDQGYTGIVSVFGSVGPRYISWERS